jgi:hypothetical protein
VLRSTTRSRRCGPWVLNLHEPVNFTIQFGNQLLVTAVVIQGLLQREDVLGSVMTLQSFGYFFARALHTTVAELRHQYRIPLTGQDRIQNRLPTGAGEVAQYVVDLQVHLAE